MNARRAWQVLGAVALAAASVAFVPLPEALAVGTAAASGTRAFAVFTSAALVALFVVLPFVFRVAGQRPLWLALAAIALAFGAGAYLAAGSAQRTCTARFNGHAVVVGTEWTSAGKT